jgi:hypothetical protein
MGGMVVDDVPARDCRAGRRREAVFPVDSRHGGGAGAAGTGFNGAVRLYNNLAGLPIPTPDQSLRSTGPQTPVHEGLRIQQQQARSLK